MIYGQALQDRELAGTEAADKFQDRRANHFVRELKQTAILSRSSSCLWLVWEELSERAVSVSCDRVCAYISDTYS